MATKIKRRTNPRVSDSGESSRATTKSAAHRKSGNGSGVAQKLEDGRIEISYQASELVPVAQYANVTIGPVQVTRIISDPGTSDEEAHDAIKQEIKFISKIVEDVIAEDRALVEESVRLHNAREEDEEKKSKRSRTK